MTRRYVVRRGDPDSVAAMLSSFGEAGRAIEEGRVFVGRERVRDPSRRVETGDEIVVHDPRDPTGTIDVVSEWNGLLAVVKPSGISTEPDRKGTASLVTGLAEALRVSVTELHAVTRLDLPVSGIVVVARGSAAARLAAQLKASGRLQRRYVALASVCPDPREGTWESPIGRDAKGRPAVRGRDARPAKTRYRVFATAGKCALLALEPVTGRTHQLRLHAADAGAPLLGDASRGPSRITTPSGRVLGATRVLLHAASIEVVTATRSEWSAAARAPEDLVSFWAELGGMAETVDAACRSAAGP